MDAGGAEKIKLSYAGQPSLFEGRAKVRGAGEVKLNILAFDRAENAGQHAISLRAE
ncbi:MAG: hypothetical protein HY697_01405 [Deltaproteobacteria bacterium]|nr:hypothetical protein [Deltaproteobacteria bacterium]